MEGEPAPAPRGFVVSTQESRDQPLKDRVPKATGIATDFWVKLFDNYNQSQESPVIPKTLSTDAIADVLMGFYMDAREKDGSLYSNASYFAARAAIQRHIATCRYNVNIVACPELKRSSNVGDEEDP